MNARWLHQEQKWNFHLAFVYLASLLLADIPISQVGRIERGEVNATVSTLAVLAKALDLAPHQLLNLE
jgi:transcriptional regulator with XRE-family HTH domain